MRIRRRRHSAASAALAVTLAVGAGAGGAGVTAHAQSPLSPAAPPATAPSLPHASSDASGTYVGDVLYVHAGEQRPAFRTATSTGKAALYALSPAGTSWTTVWTGRPVRGAVLVSDGEDLYRVGGAEVTSARRARPDLQRWDWAHERWVDLTPMPAGRTGHAAVIDGGRLWIIGGWTPSVVAEGPGARRRPPAVPPEDWRDDVLVADLDADPVTWTVVETPSLRLHSLAAAVHGDAIWVAGGMTPGGPALEVHRLDLRTRTLAPAPAPPVRGRGRGGGLGLASTGGSLYASDMNQLFRLDGGERAWQALAYDIEPERAYHALVGGPGVLSHRGGSRARSDPRRCQPGRGGLAAAERRHRRAAAPGGRGRRPTSAGRRPALARLSGAGVRSQPGPRAPAGLVGRGARRVAARGRGLRPIEPRGLGRHRVRHRHRRPAARDADRRGGRRRDRSKATAWAARSPATTRRCSSWPPTMDRRTCWPSTRPPARRGGRRTAPRRPPGRRRSSCPGAAAISWWPASTAWSRRTTPGRANASGGSTASPATGPRHRYSPDGASSSRRWIPGPISRCQWPRSSPRTRPSRSSWPATR